MGDTARAIFSIGAVSRTLDLPSATIRTWETRYGLVVPQRSPGGQRLYSRAQVEQLRFLKDAIAAGSRPGEAHRLLAERLPGVDEALHGLFDEAGIALPEGLELRAFGCTADDVADVARSAEQRGHRVVAVVAAVQEPLH